MVTLFLNPWCCGQVRASYCPYPQFHSRLLWIRALQWGRQCGPPLCGGPLPVKEAVATGVAEEGWSISCCPMS